MGVTLDDFADLHPAAAGAHAPIHGIRVVAFDLDCTLVDIIRVKQGASEAAAWALADAGVDLDPAAAGEDIFRTALRIGIDRGDVVETYLQSLLGKPDPGLVVIGQRAFENAEDASVRPYPRAHRTLLELSRRGYSLTVITDAPRWRAVRRLEAARLSHFFTNLTSLEDSPSGKADAEPYRCAARRFGVPAPEILMVGDNPARDVGVARAFGCRTVLAQYGLQEAFASDLPEHRADRTIRWVDELLQILPDRGEGPRDAAGSSRARRDRR